MYLFNSSLGNESPYLVIIILDKILSACNTSLEHSTFYYLFNPIIVDLVYGISTKIAISPCAKISYYLFERLYLVLVSFKSFEIYVTTVCS